MTETGPAAGSPNDRDRDRRAEPAGDGCADAGSHASAARRAGVRERPWRQLPVAALIVSVVVAASGVTLATVAAAETRAAPGFTACASQRGVLRLLSAKGSCAAGYHRVVVGQRGATGRTGPKGSAGPRGPAGPAGMTGHAGTPGVAGANGRTVLNGASAPSVLFGSSGDFYLDTTSHALYGPAVRTCTPICFTHWGNPTALVGPAGPTGATGPVGPSGPSGAAGVSATVQRGAGAIYVTPSGTPLLVFPVQSGRTYLVSAIGTAASLDELSLVTCALYEANPKETIQVATTTVSANQAASAFVLSAVITPGLSGYLRLICASPDDVQITGSTMTELSLTP